MPAVLLDPPKPGTYKRVLVRKDYHWDMEWAFIYYDENVNSRGILHRGVRLMTVFLNSEHAIDYALKTGWIDVSEHWFHDHPEAATGAPVEPEPQKSNEPTTEQSKKPINDGDVPGPKKSKK